MDFPAPTVGRIVHYVSYGTPGGEYSSQCRAAIITEVAGNTVGLAVLNPEGMYFTRDIVHNEAAEAPGDPDCSQRDLHGTLRPYCSCGWIEPGHQSGTWHWPERS